tara:strand:- start:139 stop:354 length:216 start_codon:yes stop_codon:yes gene_type:complete
MIFLLIITGIPNCSQGWVVGSLPLTPQDTVTNTVFIEIVDADSTMHWYHGKIYEYSNWCYRHDEWEDIRIK